ncbi:MAG: hypothetical protein JRJ48_07190 [Deltaproteobacteria bacterium]|nr:hypothetical protein [Deltaproteobacteria bacterium]
MKKISEEIKNLKLGRKKMASEVYYREPYSKLLRNDGYVLIIDKGKFPGNGYLEMKGEVLKWVLRILDQVAIHPVPVARDAIFPVWFGKQPYTGYGFGDSRLGVFILFAFDWDEVYWYLEEEMGEEEAEEISIPNPLWDIGKTIPGFVSFEAGYIDQLETPFLLGFYKKGCWVPVEF